jgi:hypothetical protein
LELNDKDASTPGRLFPDVTSLWGKGWEIAIERVEVSVSGTEAPPPEWFRASPDTSFFLDDGSPLSSAGEFVNAIVKSSVVIDKMYRDATAEHKFLELVLEPPKLGKNTVSVQKQEPVVIRPIERLRIVAKCVVTVDEFPLRHGVYGDLRVAWGQGTILGRAALLVATDGLGTPPKITMRVDGCDVTVG